MKINDVYEVLFLLNCMFVNLCGLFVSIYMHYNQVIRTLDKTSRAPGRSWLPFEKRWIIMLFIYAISIVNLYSFECDWELFIHVRTDFDQDGSGIFTGIILACCFLFVCSL
jgi:hypothetical protein